MEDPARQKMTLKGYPLCQKVTPKGSDQAPICDDLGVRMCWPLTLPILHPQLIHIHTTSSIPLLEFAVWSGSVVQTMGTMPCLWQLLKGKTGPVLRRSLAPPLQNEMEEHSFGAKAELLHVISKTVEELGLEWSPPVESVCSWLDDWFLQSCHHQRAKG